VSCWPETHGIPNGACASSAGSRTPAT
jgi:hypothetical protein